MEKKFSSRDIAEFKRTARNVWPLEAKRIKVAQKIKEAQEELEYIEKSISLKEAYVMSETGHHVMDIVDRVVTNVPMFNEDGTPKLDEKGKQVIVTTTDFVLKYPETVIPAEEVVAESVEGTTVEDSETVDETETPAADAPFNPIENA